MWQKQAGVILALGAFITLYTSPALAQQTESDASKDANGRFEYMSEQLNLTPEQKPKVKAIVDQQMQQWAVLSQNKTLNGKQKIAKMQGINQDAQNRIDKILTPQQREKLHAMMEASKPQPVPPKYKRPRIPRPKE